MQDDQNPDRMARPRQFNRALVDALGLDRHKVRSIDIATSVDNLPTVRVELLVSEVNAKRILELVRYYRLVPDPDCRIRRVAVPLRSPRPDAGNRHVPVQDPGRPGYHAALRLSLQTAASGAIQQGT